MSATSPAHIQAFLTKWQASGGAERSNAHTFLNELCDILEVERPQHTTPDKRLNAYCFEKAIPNASTRSLVMEIHPFLLHLFAKRHQRAHPIKTTRGLRCGHGSDQVALFAS